MEMLLVEVALKEAVRELIKGVKVLIKNYREFEPVLEDIAQTLEALEPLISILAVQNTELHLTVLKKVTAKIQKDIEEGQKLVKEYSEVGPSLLGCLKKSTKYTERLRKLDLSLRRQLDILNTQNLLLLLFREMNLQNCLEWDDQIQVEDASLPIQMDVAPVEVDRVKHVSWIRKMNDKLTNISMISLPTIFLRRANLLGAVGGGAHMLLINFVSEFIQELNQLTVYKRIMIRLLKSVVSTLDNARPVFHHLAQLNDELNLPKEEVLEDMTQEIDEGKVLLSKLSKVKLFNMYKNANKTLDWLQTLQWKLFLLNEHGISDVKYLHSIRKSNKVATEVEMPNDIDILEERFEQIATIMDLLGKINRSSFCMETKDIKELLRSDFASNESRLKKIISMVDSLEPLIHEIAKISEEMDLPRKGVEECLDRVHNLCKASHWSIFKKYSSMNTLIEREYTLQRHLHIMITQVIGNVKKYLVSMRKTSEVVSRIETSSTSQIEPEVNSCEAGFDVTKKTVILNDVNCTSDPLLAKLPNDEVSVPAQLVSQFGWAMPLKDSQNEILKDVNCSEDAHSASASNDDVLVPMQSTSPLKIPKLRTVFPPRLRQPQNKKKRLEHKTHIFSSDDPTLLSPGHNASTHSHHMPSPNSTITIEFCQERSSGEESIVDGQLRKHLLPVDLERYGKEESSHLSRVGMQDMYLVKELQRFHHVMSTRLSQFEERNAMLETNYRNAEESWKLENLKLSEQCNFAMAQVASLIKEKNSLAEKIGFLEKNKVTARQEAHEILTKEWEPEFKREMQEAEKECFKLGCTVGYKSFLAKVENKFPNLDLSGISHFEPIEFDMKVIEDLLGPDHDNEPDNDSDDCTDHSDQENENDVERGGNSVAEVRGDALERLYHFIVHDMIDGTTITVDIEKEVLGVEPMYILREDITQFKEMTPISATCINVYMRHLHDVLKRSMVDGIFRFCEASSISVGTPDGKSQVLATRLQQLSTNQILLVPYNSGCHWTLTIINEEKDICYFMDPIHSLTDPVEWKSIVNNGIEQWNYHQTDRALQKRPVWKIVKGAKQPSHVECGYYVMRYMKEMVEDKVHSFAIKWDSKKYFNAYKDTERAYTKTEVDEVQREWASLVFQQKLRRP